MSKLLDSDINAFAEYSRNLIAQNPEALSRAVDVIRNGLFPNPEFLSGIKANFPQLCETIFPGYTMEQKDEMKKQIADCDLGTILNANWARADPAVRETIMAPGFDMGALMNQISTILPVQSIVDSMQFRDAIERFFEGTAESERSQLCGLDQKSIERLPRKHALLQADAVNFDLDCSICLASRKGQFCETASAESIPIILLSCGHMFDEACISKWLERVNMCPLCRKVVPIATIQDVD